MRVDRQLQQEELFSRFFCADLSSLIEISMFPSRSPPAHRACGGLSSERQTEVSCNECISDCRAARGSGSLEVFFLLFISGRVAGCEQLTVERSDQHISILDELLDEFVCSLQLELVALEALPEVRAVHDRVAELQRRESHRVSVTGSARCVELKFRLLCSSRGSAGMTTSLRFSPPTVQTNFPTSLLSWLPLWISPSPPPVSATFLKKKQGSSDSCWSLYWLQHHFVWII